MAFTKGTITLDYIFKVKRNNQKIFALKIINIICKIFNIKFEIEIESSINKGE
jgi:hypothetical protein